jgi:predicted short-subunit dehydrogenase-like oxidoreductase (DUF2520 family)
VTRRTLHLFGAGRAGTALVRLLHLAGHPVGRIVARSDESARTAAAIVGAGSASTDPLAAFTNDAVTLIGLPESLLARVAAELAPRLPPLAGCVALHLSGVLPGETIAPLRAAGVSVGSLHPLASFAERPRPPATLERVTFDVDGDAAARVVARELAHELGAHVVELAPDGKALFHAAAVVASNGLVTLFDLACRLAERAGASPLAARGAMTMLAASTLENLGHVGSPAALTGPIERGEADVVERHLAALANHPADRARYVELARAILEVAVRKQSLLPAQYEAIRRALDR